MLGVYQGRAVAVTVKGGGRESDVRERSTEVGERTTVPERARKDAAAIPAALDILRSRRDFIDPVTYRKILVAVRALEAENRILTDVMRKEIAKARALEAELNDYRNAHAQEQEWRNKAEARVKELEAILADLRGEDRG